MENIKLTKFKEAVNNFSKSKFILYSHKLPILLKAIADTDEVYKLVAKCLTGFDFETEKNQAATKEGFKLPVKAEKIVALIFCLLVDIQDKKIDFYKFLKQFFPSDDINESYELFCQKIVVPFKNVITVLIEGPDEEEEEVKEEEITVSDAEEQSQTETPKESELTIALTKACDDLILKAESRSDCYNSFIILKAMKEAVKQGNLELFDSLRVALLCSSKNHKFIKYARFVLDEIMD